MGVIILSQDTIQKATKKPKSYWGVIKVEYPLETGKEPFLDLIEKSESLLQIVQDPDYFTREISSALMQAYDRGVNIELIQGACEQYQQSDGLVALLNRDNVNLYTLPERPNGHFVIADRKHAGVEEFHLPGTLPTEAYIIKYDGSSLFNTLNGDFQKMKYKAMQRS